MTAAVEVDDPLVAVVARQIAVAIAEEWGHDAEHPYVDEQARRLTSTVRATIERIKEAGRLLPEEAKRRVQFSVTRGKDRQLLDDGASTPAGVQRWWTGAGIERRIVWETQWASVEAS